LGSEVKEELLKLRPTDFQGEEGGREHRALQVRMAYLWSRDRKDHKESRAILGHRDRSARLGQPVRKESRASEESRGP
jgi:hypothetical protein